MDFRKNFESVRGNAIWDGIKMMIPFGIGETARAWLLGHPTATSWLAAAAAATLLAWPRTKPQEPPLGDLVIEEARWVSVDDGSKFFDVTDVAQNHVRGGRLEMDAGDQLLGDPHPGSAKRLDVKFSRRGDVSIGHGGKLAL